MNSNSCTTMTLKSSVVIFQALEPLQPQWSLQPQWASQTHFIKKYLFWWFDYPCVVPKWQILVSFSEMGHQKSKFSLISESFLSKTVQASQCYFFESWLMKLKCPSLISPQCTINQKNCWSFYPSEPFTLDHITMRHPVHLLLCTYPLQ